MNRMLSFVIPVDTGIQFLDSYLGPGYPLSRV